MSSATHDLLNVTGAVSLARANLVLNIASGSTFASNFVLINNDGADAITGTFAGLAQGAAITSNGFTFYADYFGGDGNDFQLDVTPVPEPSTWAAALLTLGAIGWSHRRRLLARRRPRGGERGVGKSLKPAPDFTRKERRASKPPSLLLL